jgi:hypothetical protein
LTVLLGVVVVLTALVIAGVAAGVRFAPDSRDQARLAERDTLWTHVPSAMRESSRFTGLADAAWVPQLGSTSHLSSASVGRYYATNEPHSEALARWDQAAAAAGWRLTLSSCHALHDPELGYEKMLGRWSASLTTSFVGDYLFVVISFPYMIPATPATLGAGLPACK